MKTQELDGFTILERLSEGAPGSYKKHPDTPIIFISKTVVGIGGTAVKYLNTKAGDRSVLLEKKGVFYLAVLPFHSTINGYKMSNVTNSTNMLVFNCKAHSRGLAIGYYRLLEPVFIGGLDLYELEEFDINQ